MTALLQRTQAVVQRRNLAETTFGKLAVGDDKAVGRLQGNRLVVRTVVRLERYLDACDQEDGVLKDDEGPRAAGAAP